MKEIYDFRVMDKRVLRKLPRGLGRTINAKLKFLKNGKRNPTYFEIRQILISKDDDHFDLIKKLVQKYPLDFAWNGIRRIYSDDELKEAEAFYMRITKAFEPAGVECGTIYEESEEYKRYGTPRNLVGYLKLDKRSLPKRQGWARTIADELVVTEDIVELINNHNFTGIEFNPVIDCKNNKFIDGWSQPVILGRVSANTGITEFGIKPFVPDKKNEFVIPECNITGLNKISELTIQRPNLLLDFNYTFELEGHKMGLLVPSPLMVISPRVYEAFTSNNILGIRIERVNISS